MSQHIVRSYDAEFAEIDRLVAEMGGHAEKLLSDAFQALEKRDAALGELAASSDRLIDELERRVQDRAIEMIARRQPVANDLRHVMTVLKIVGDLERIGDLAKNMAKRGIALANESPPRPLMNGIRHMTELARRQLQEVLDSFGTSNANGAMAVWRSDERLDELYNSVFRELLTYMMEDPRYIGLCTHLLFSAKNLERIGDHTTNIAENVVYLVTGQTIQDARPKGEDTSRLLIQPATSTES